MCSCRFHRSLDASIAAPPCFILLHSSRSEARPGCSLYLTNNADPKELRLTSSFDLAAIWTFLNLSIRKMWV
ncbi:hypothetical protein EV356DRAFT_496456 [Viridothelium virens]|uniref:Uncharacterized protein n=1 Tax=Viridothelium virens TaxID=1048519 RepID=A0A6A6GV36_VIRVR|nr:hypothetical protein EV356DRAFT_496456 [Viridothelium virens]